MKRLIQALRAKEKKVVENGCFFNEHGELVSQQVNIVYGAPGRESLPM